MADDKMTKADWDAKDRRISKLSCMSTAADAKLADTAEGLILEAEKLLNWVYDEKPTSNVVSDTSYPTPTMDQKQALGQIAETTGWTAGQVFARFKRFPTMETVESCIAGIKRSEGVS